MGSSREQALSVTRWEGWCVKKMSAVSLDATGAIECWHYLQFKITCARHPRWTPHNGMVRREEPPSSVRLPIPRSGLVQMLHHCAIPGRITSISDAGAGRPETTRAPQNFITLPVSLCSFASTDTTPSAASHSAPPPAAMPAKPRFDALPLRKDGPPGNAWGLFGPDDELGMLNLLTPEIRAAAAQEIVDGTAVSTDLPLDYMSRPCFGRAPFEQTIKNKAPRAVNDDTLCFNTQSSSQWDGFRHYAYQDAQLYFNGRTPEEVANSKIIGIGGMNA